MAMVPHERSLVKRMQGRPFALIGVNADGNQEEARKRVEKDGINWRSFWDGRGGRIVKDYRVQYFPTIYVLDGNGVIRYREVRDEAMDRAVDALLKEAEPKKK
jgi:hypothetical protein